jgi:hypothetical protein
MRFALSLLLVAGIVQAAPPHDPPHLQGPSASAVSLTIVPVPARLPFGTEATFKIEITNVSSTSQYLSADTPDTLQYAVKSSSGKSLVGFSDPPPPPRVPPIGYNELIWLRPGTSLVFYQHLPLSALGITAPGRYRVSGVLSSYIFTNAQWLAKYQSIFLTFAPWVTLEVVGGQGK